MPGREPGHLKSISRRGLCGALARAGRQAAFRGHVVDGLRQKGRSRVLICPAVFCADAETMQSLRRTVGDSLRGMDAHWLPGLGGELVR